jgi:hypothetical protein
MQAEIVQHIPSSGRRYEARFCGPLAILFQRLAQTTAIERVESLASMSLSALRSSLIAGSACCFTGGVILGHAMITTPCWHLLGFFAGAAGVIIGASRWIRLRRVGHEYSQTVMKHWSREEDKVVQHDIDTVWTIVNSTGSIERRSISMWKYHEKRWTYIYYNSGGKISGRIIWSGDICKVMMRGPWNMLESWYCEVPPKMSHLLFPRPLVRSMTLGSEQRRLRLQYDATGTCSSMRMYQREKPDVRMLELLRRSRIRLVAREVTRQHDSLIPDVCFIIAAFAVPLHGTYEHAPSYDILFARLERTME